MRHPAYVAVLLFTSLFAAGANTVIVRSVSVPESNTYIVQGSGFSPKKGAAPVVSINGVAITIKSFTDRRIVGTLSIPAAGDYTLTITNSQGYSTTFKFVVETPEKGDSSLATRQEEQKKSPLSPGTKSDPGNQRWHVGVCQINEVTPGMIVPKLPSYCYSGDVRSQ
jgi:hypothetical protein